MKLPTETLIHNINKYKNAEGKLDAPLDNFMFKLAHAQEVLDATYNGIKPFIEKHKIYKLGNDSFKEEKDTRLRLEAQQHFIIALVTALEVFFKDLFINIIRIKEKEPEFLGEKSKLKSELKDSRLSLYDFYITYRKHEVSLADILAHSRTFLDITKTNGVFSELLGKSLIDNVMKVKFLHGKDVLELQELYPDIPDMIDNLIEVRHQVVHQVDFDLNSKVLDMDHMLNYFKLLHFAVAIDYFLTNELGSDFISAQIYKDYANQILAPSI